MEFLKNFFKKNTKEILIIKPELNDQYEWVEFEVQKPPHKVVLAAFNSYDCGWVIDTAWWYEKENCWMTTGNIMNTRAYLKYTHWTFLPNPPQSEN